MGALIQVSETTESIKQIGFAATIALLCLLAIGAGVRYLFKYFTGRLDRKDDQVIKLVDDRHQDLMRMVESQELVRRGQEKIVEALTTLATELRGEWKKKR